MKYIKYFESNSPDRLLDEVDYMGDYIRLEATTSTKVGGAEFKWTNRDFSRIVEDDVYKKTKGSGLIKYYIFGFLGLENFFAAESDIRRNCQRLGLRFLVINWQTHENECKVIFVTKQDYEKLDLDGFATRLKKDKKDLLLEEDVKIDKSEFDIIYEDDDIIAVKPKTYKAAIRWAADTNWKMALKSNLNWIQKYLTKGSYYGGFNWYKSKKVTTEVDSWWRRILRLPKKQSEKEVKEFIQDFPRYLLYIVIFKNYTIEDKYRKLYLLFDVSRSEYGEDVKSFSSDRVMFGGYWGDKLDSAHNNLKISNASSRVTLKDIFAEHGHHFSPAFTHIDYDYNHEKDRMCDLLGIWADKGGEYRDDSLVFLRSDKEPNRLTVTRPSLVKKDDKGNVSWQKLGYYDDPNFDWWELDKETPEDRRAPEGGYKDLFASIAGNVDKIKNALDNTDYKV
jgi:hypothetical protein